jgi:hypothetical protein
VLSKHGSHDCRYVSGRTITEIRDKIGDKTDRGTIAGMTNEEIEPWLEKKVAVTLIDGSKRTGTLMAGVGDLCHILGEPSPIVSAQCTATWRIYTPSRLSKSNLHKS